MKPDEKGGLTIVWWDPKDEKNNNWEGREAERGNHVIITGYGPWLAASRSNEDKRQFIRNKGRFLRKGILFIRWRRTRITEPFGAGILHLNFSTPCR